MIEEHAKVVGLNGENVIIEAARTSACGQCQAADSCGQKSLSEWAASKMANIEIVNPNRLSVNVGDSIIVGINEGGFIKASALIYLLPLILMVITGVVAQALSQPESLIITSSFVGLAVGFCVVRFFGKKLETRHAYRPILLRVS
jgi:sigma-E factor negative regulatory protein RseC